MREFTEFWDNRVHNLLPINKRTGINVKDIVSELVRIRQPTFQIVFLVLN